MAVLVTGGAGYIGSHMVHALLDRGEKVVVIDNLSTGVRDNVAEDAVLVVADIADHYVVRAAIKTHGVDAIVHFAGSIVVPDSVADPLSYYLNNTVKTRSLLASAIAERVPNFIFSSTAAVYGMPQTNPVVEDCQLSPISPYGASKMMTEMMLADCAHAYPLTYTALRYFNVAGADPQGRTGQSTPRATHLIKVACQAALGMRNGMDIFGTDFDTPDGTGVRDYIHVSDLVAAHVKALDRLREGKASLVANCGYGRGFSVREVIEAVKKASGVDFPVREGPRRAGDPAALISACDRARNELGWVPQYDDLDTIVTHALAWERRISGLRMAS